MPKTIKIPITLDKNIIGTVSILPFLKEMTYPTLFVTIRGEQGTKHTTVEWALSDEYILFVSSISQQKVLSYYSIVVWETSVENNPIIPPSIKLFGFVYTKGRRGRKFVYSVGYSNAAPGRAPFAPFTKKEISLLKRKKFLEYVGKEISKAAGELIQKNEKSMKKPIEIILELKLEPSHSVRLKGDEEVDSVSPIEMWVESGKEGRPPEELLLWWFSLNQHKLGKLPHYLWNKNFKKEITLELVTPQKIIKEVYNDFRVF